jgi:hypothetical protein
VYNDENTDTYNPLELWNLLVDEHMFGNVITGTSTSTDIQIAQRFVETDTQQSLHLLTRTNESDLVITRKYMDSDNDDQLIQTTAGIFPIRNENMLYSFGFTDDDDGQFHHKHPNIAIAYAIKSSYVCIIKNDPSPDPLTYFGGYSERERECHGYGVTICSELGTRDSGSAVRKVDMALWCTKMVSRYT